MAKKYLEVMNNGSQDLYILDKEAQAAIGYSQEFVDLGLPSGTLWAKCNVGATEETGYGKYYMYGKGAREYDSSDSPYEGTENPLDPTKDTATQVYGLPWHMPTKAQFDELVANTNYTWETNFGGSGINGGKFTSKTDNTKYVFFPAAGGWDGDSQSDVGSGGLYWSSTPYGFNDSYFVYFNSSNLYPANYSSRLHGFTVRPVCDTLPLNDLSVATLQECAEAASEITFVDNN